MPSGYPKSGVNKGWFKNGICISHSEETKRKIGLANSIALKGKKMPLEVRRKISKSVIGKNSGSKNGNWRGGTSHKPYKKGWNVLLRESIKQRDNYTCQECGKKQMSNERRFAVHHIDYKKDNHHPSNLILLCNSCHGKTTYTKKIEFYKERYFVINKRRFNDYNRASNKDEGIV